MAISTKHYGAGLQHAQIKLADGNVYDIEAIVSASGEYQIDDIAVKGDDTTKTTFYSNQREELSLTANAISFDVVQGLTGNNYTSSATGIEIPMGTTSEQNPPFVELSVETLGKDDAGSAVVIRKTWHRVQIGQTSLNQAGESEFSVEMAGTAYTTDEDIEGNALASQRIATIEVIYPQD